MCHLLCPLVLRHNKWNHQSVYNHLDILCGSNRQMCPLILRHNKWNHQIVYNHLDTLFGSNRQMCPLTDTFVRNRDKYVCWELVAMIKFIDETLMRQWWGAMRRDERVFWLCFSRQPADGNWWNFQSPLVLSQFARINKKIYKKPASKKVKAPLITSHHRQQRTRERERERV